MLLRDSVIKKILLYSVYLQTYLKRESFTVYSGWNETYKLPAHSWERTVCLLRQPRIGAK